MNWIPFVLVAGVAIAGCEKTINAPAPRPDQLDEQIANTQSTTPISIGQKWFSASNLTRIGRTAAFGFSIGSKGYVGGGSGGLPVQSPRSLADFWEYDPTTNAWTQKANLPLGLERAASFVVGTKGYVCTGYHVVPPDSPSYYNTNVNYLFQYDQTSNTWTQRSAFPGGARDGAVGLNIGTEGYVGTGNNSGEFVKDWYQYDPPRDRWTRKADLPGSGRMFSSSFTIDGYGGFVCCGYGTGPTDFNDVWVYFPGSDTWGQAASLPGSAREQAVGFSYGSTGGGIACGLHYAYPSPNVLLNDYWYYQLSTNQWQQRPSLAGAARAGAAGFAINNTPYIGTGWNYNGNLNDFWYLGLYLF